MSRWNCFIGDAIGVIKGEEGREGNDSYYLIKEGGLVRGNGKERLEDSEVEASVQMVFDLSNRKNI